jgi:hypothetical protein
LHSGRINKIFEISTIDGVNWTKPKLIFNDKHAYLSPAIIFDNGVYKVWYSDYDGKLHYKQTKNLFSWPQDTVVNLNLVGYNIWHQDVIKNNLGYEIVFCAYNQKVKNSVDAQCLYFASSKDGINFNDPVEILKPSISSDAYDNQMIYRSSLVNINGKYKLFYSGLDKKREWHIFETNLI